jgi:ATP-binding cassette, subfamily B, bacterial
MATQSTSPAAADRASSSAAAARSTPDRPWFFIVSSWPERLLRWCRPEGRLRGPHELGDRQELPSERIRMLSRAQYRIPPPSGRPNPSLRERFDALRNLPPFLRQIWATSRALTLASLGLRLLRALLPVLMLYVGKLIIDEAVRLVAAGIGDVGLAGAWRSGVLDGLAAAGDRARPGDPLRPARPHGQLRRQHALGAVHQRHQRAADGARRDARPRGLRGQRAAGPLDRARRQTMGRMNLMASSSARLQDAITVVSFAAGLLVYAPWLIVLLAVALVPAFVGESHFNALGYSLNYAWTPERRQLEYVRQMGASVETAKEVKIFGLHRFLIARYRELADASSAPTGARPAARRLGRLLAALGTLGYYAPTPTSPGARSRGDFTIGDLTFLAGSFRRLRSCSRGC